MANLDEYWKQVSSAESFQDLGDDEKEKVRNHLFEKYVQSSNSYISLPQSQRMAVKKHFDDTTKIEPETMVDSVVKTGKKLVKEAKPVIDNVSRGTKVLGAGLAVAGKDIADRAGQAVDVSKIPSDIEDIESTGMEIPGAKKAKEAVSGAAEKLGSAMEPSEQAMEQHAMKGGRLTNFDMARMIGSGAVKTAGEFISGLIPETNIGLSAYLSDSVLRYAGTTFLGKPISGIWKPKSGLSSSASEVGDMFEKVITSRRVEVNAKNAPAGLITDHVIPLGPEGSTDMLGGPPKPLEVLAKKEQELKAQSEVQEYEEWLQKADKTSDRGGAPEDDLYPATKTNVSQLRDAAKERLQKLQAEPVHVESLSRAEDGLAGYYRRRIDQMKVYMMPAGPATEPQALLPEGPRPAGLIEGPEPKKAQPPTPAKAKLTPSPQPTAVAPAQVPQRIKAKDLFAKMYAELYPDQTKQAINVRAGAALKGFGYKATEELSPEHVQLVGKFMEQEHLDYLATHPEAKAPVPDSLAQLREAAGFPAKDPRDIKQKSTFNLISDINKSLGEKGQIGGGEIDPVKQAALQASVEELVDRAMALGYQTTQDIMTYAARNAPKEIQDAIRKNLAPTLSAFDTHGYKEMEAAKNGNAVAKQSMMDSAEQSYLQKASDIIKGKYKKFKANQQVVVFKDMDEGLMRIQNDLFIHDNYRKFSKDELAAQRWFTEGKSPKLESLTAQGVKEEDAKRWLELAKNPTENMKSARKMTQIFEDEYHDLISEFYDKVGYVEDHVTRRWKQDREYMDWEGRTLGNKPNFVKGRKLLTQADGIDAGYEPVAYDIREDLRASNNQRVNILSRIHAYQKLGASFGPDGMPAIMDEAGDSMTQAKNAKITPHSGQAPNSWLRFEHVPLLKGLAIHPYYKPALDFMMARPFQGTVPDVLDFLSASTKATKLMGFFHGYTLGEMTMSGISYRDVFSFGKDRNPLFKGLRYLAKGMMADMEGRPLSKNPAKAVGELYNSFMTGSTVLANRPLALEMAEHGFKFASADEDMGGVLRKFLNKTEDFLKKRIGDKAAKGITALPRGALDIQEKALWSYVRPISSMLVYENNLADAIKTFSIEAPEGKKIPIEDIKTSIANQTSKEMGGISYARLMINPRTQQVLQWVMLAPGWTIGRALMGASVLEKGPEGRQARKQMAKLFVAWYISSNMINYAQTKKYLGKGRFMHDNPEGYKGQAFLSKKKDGTTQYLQMSKALTEIYDDVTHPMRTAAYKLAAPIQAAAKVMNWATAKTYYPGLEPDNPLTSALHAYEPLAGSGQSAYGGIPLHRGPSRNRIEGVLDEYYKGGMKNPALFQEAMQMATEEGFDVSKLSRAVRAAKTAKENKAMFK